MFYASGLGRLNCRFEELYKIGDNVEMSGWGGPNIDLPIMRELYEEFKNDPYATHGNNYILRSYTIGQKEFSAENSVINNIIKQNNNNYIITFLTYDQGDMERLTLKGNTVVSYRVSPSSWGGRRKSRKRSHKKRATRRKH